MVPCVTCKWLFILNTGEQKSKSSTGHGTPSHHSPFPETELSPSPAEFASTQQSHLGENVHTT